ncbi:hypothetical protein JW960_18355 [candidate division KSB1 bacterium]|nr:hypothetical protein [candidate division KSB1 bacterium]
MKIRNIGISFGMYLVIVLGFVVLANGADPCDRACLEKLIDDLLEAMIAHNPSQLMLARDVRYTENGVELRLGDGMWGTLSTRGKYSIYVSDPETGQVGFYGTVDENGGMNYIALRLKVFELLIEEIEAIVVRPSGMNITPDQKPARPTGQVMDEKKHRPQFLQTVPSTEQMTRTRLTEIANSYFTGLANQTGNFTAPFAKTCERWENGYPRQTRNRIPILPKTCPIFSA